ncbi:thiamine biosynthesis protein [Pseudonocardiaceae bacterium YIM PH 21723]|nr:thiamine biosynthesis protein [Pseudonocardiaceae bacterium YIM PH 21723]
MRTRATALCLAVVLSVSSCNGAADTGAAADDNKVTYLTSFSTFGRDSYVYVAQEKGYFDEVGLDVKVTPGTGTVDVLRLVASGRATFGTADFTGSVITVAREKLPVTTVGIVHQKSLAALVSLSDKGITKPSDLAGKRIADSSASTMQLMWTAYAKRAGLDSTAVTFVPAAPPVLPQLLAAGKVDAIGQFTVGLPLIEKAAKGKKVSVLPYGDVLQDMYGNALVTTRKLVSDNPNLVFRFKKALFKGLQYAIENPEEAGKILRKYQPTQDAGVAAAELKLMGPAVHPPGSTIGASDPERVRRTISMMEESGSIPFNSINERDIVAATE